MEDERLHSDMELEKEIQEQLAWDYRLDTSDVEVHVNNGNVLLTGTVPSDVIRILVTRNVATVPGVADVSNQLEVGELLTDLTHESIETRLMQMLREAKDVDTSHVRITAVESGMVILEGETDTYWEKKKIEELVTSFIGTVGVENRITIEPNRNVEDENIAQDINANLLESEKVNLDALNIRVHDGRVTISGNVPTWTAYNTIYEAVMVTYGVTHINLDIDIQDTF